MLIRCAILAVSIFSFTHAVGATNRCYNPSTKSTVFSDQPCEAMGYIRQGSVNTPAYSPDTSTPSYSAGGSRNYPNYYPPKKNSGTLGNDSKKYRCAALKQRINQAEALRDSKAAADARYEWNKSDCGF